MAAPSISRRSFLVQSGIGLAGFALVNSRLAAFALQPGDTIIPWVDQRAENPVPQVIANQQTWEDLDTWITPNDKFFSIAHYNRPVLDAADFRLRVNGRVRDPLTLTLEDIKALPRQELIFTLECSGNSGLPFFDAGIGNAVWAGTPLAPILERAGILDDGREVAFYGADTGEETFGEQTVTQNFARSMSLEDAMSSDNILCYEMNGEPLPVDNGFPLRLIAPGWYGVASVKWLDRIELRDSRLMNRFMARDYVTLRQEQADAGPVWTESSVGRARLKSAPGRVVQHAGGYRVDGAAWGASIASVDVRIDDGEWAPAQIDTSQIADYGWVFWSYDWPDAQPGDHTVTARATDTAGNVQPAPDDPFLAGKATYWESNGQITRRVTLA